MFSFFLLRSVQNMLQLLVVDEGPGLQCCQKLGFCPNIRIFDHEI